MLTNEYEQACKEFDLKPADIRELMRLDRKAQFHKHEIVRGRQERTWCSLAQCRICDKSDFGWYCPKSPTHLCDYRQEDGTWDADMCRYCGEPRERK